MGAWLALHLSNRTHVHSYAGLSYLHINKDATLQIQRIPNKIDTLIMCVQHVSVYNMLVLYTSMRDMFVCSHARHDSAAVSVAHGNESCHS